MKMIPKIIITYHGVLYLEIRWHEHDGITEWNMAFYAYITISWTA